MTKNPSIFDILLRLSLPFGIDDSVAADYLCQQKKQWKMESTKQIRSIRPIRGQKSNPPSLPFREGSGVGFHPFRKGQGVGFPLTKREARLTKRACERLTKCEARLTHKKGVSSVPHPYSLPFREGLGVGSPPKP